MIDKIIELDKELFTYLNKNESATDFFWIFITDRKVMFIMLLSLIIYLLYKYEKNNFKLTLFLIIITFTSTDLIHNHFFKEVFQRPRPCYDPQISETCRLLVKHCGEYGFVSGHAANFFGIMSIIFFRLPNIKTLIKFIFFIWGLLICYSRIHVGKHYPLDVFFGAILGSIIAYMVYKFVFLFLSKKKYNY